MFVCGVLHIRALIVLRRIGIKSGEDASKIGCAANPGRKRDTQSESATSDFPKPSSKQGLIIPAQVFDTYNDLQLGSWLQPQLPNYAFERNDGFAIPQSGTLLNISGK